MKKHKYNINEISSTLVGISSNDELLGVIYIEDIIRDNAKEMI